MPNFMASYRNNKRCRRIILTMIVIMQLPASLRIRRVRGCWRRNRWVQPPSISRGSWRRSIFRYKNCCISGNVLMNYTITIRLIWPMRRDLPRSFIYSRLKFSTRIRCWGNYRQGESLRLWRTPRLIRSGMSVSRPQNTAQPLLSSSNKIWKPISSFKTATTKPATSWAK